MSSPHIFPRKRKSEKEQSPIDFQCSNCNKSNVSIYMHSCISFLCEECHQLHHGLLKKCTGCDDPVTDCDCIKLKINRLCKYHEQGFCNAAAQFKCQCISNGYVCGDHLQYLHSRRVSGPCKATPLTFDTLGDRGKCADCGEFIAQYRTKGDGKLICLECRNKYVDTEDLDDINMERVKINNEYAQTKRLLKKQIKRTEEILLKRATAVAEEDATLKYILETIKDLWDKQKAKTESETGALLDKLNKAKNTFLLLEGGRFNKVVDAIFKNTVSIDGDQEKLVQLIKNYKKEDSSKYDIKFNPIRFGANEAKLFGLLTSLVDKDLMKGPTSSHAN